MGSAKNKKGIATFHAILWKEAAMLDMIWKILDIFPDSILLDGCITAVVCIVLMIVLGRNEDKN